MAYPEDLLEQASLRRAVSSAYYALFHLLISETVKNWKRPQERFTLARMFEHASMRSACKKRRDDLREYLNSISPKPATPESYTGRQLLNVMEAFVDMHQQRQTADYDGSKIWSRVEVLERVEAVKEAFSSWKAIKDHPDAQNFLTTLLLKERKS